MNLTCSFSTVNPAAADVDLLVVPVYANGELGPGAEVVAAAFTGAISDYMAAAGFAGKPGQILRVPVSGLPALSALLVGVGESWVYRGTLLASTFCAFSSTTLNAAENMLTRSYFASQPFTSTRASASIGAAS